MPRPRRFSTAGIHSTAARPASCRSAGGASRQCRQTSGASALYPASVRNPNFAGPAAGPLASFGFKETLEIHDFIVVFVQNSLEEVAAGDQENLGSAAPVGPPNPA